MTGCTHYQAQLLEDLFGLLDAEDSRDLRQHLHQCDECRAALLRAED